MSKHAITSPGNRHPRCANLERTLAVETTTDPDTKNITGEILLDVGGTKITISETAAKELWESHQFDNYNLAFFRLVTKHDFSLNALTDYYNEEKTMGMPRQYEQPNE